MATKTWQSSERFNFVSKESQGSVVSTTYKSTGVLTATSSRTGVSLPGYKSIIKNGGNATTALSLIRHYTDTHQPYSASVTANVGTRLNPIFRTVESDGFESPLMTYPATVSAIPAEATANNQALKRAYAAVLAQQQSFSGMVFLGELASTIAMFRRPYQGIVRNMTRYLDRLTGLRRPSKGGNRARDLERLSKDIASTWLETSFGLVPLISDVKDAAEAIARFQDDRIRAVVSGSGKAERISTSNDIVGLSGNPWAQARRTSRRSDSYEVRYRVGVDARRSANFGSAGRLLELSGFQPQAFIPTLYELVPWSWLVDYVSNLGDVINTSCQSQAYVSWVCRTIVRRGEATAYINPEYSTAALALNQVQGQFSDGTFRSITVQVSRDSFAQLPSMQLQFEVPTSLLQVANVVAVLRGRERAIIDRLTNG